MLQPRREDRADVIIVQAVVSDPAVFPIFHEVHVS